MERALDQGKECGDILQLVTAARGAMNGLMAELLEDHVRFHVLFHRARRPRSRRSQPIELMEIVRSYLK